MKKLERFLKKIKGKKEKRKKLRLLHLITEKRGEGEGEGEGERGTFFFFFYSSLPRHLPFAMSTMLHMFVLTPLPRPSTRDCSLGILYL